ncbi:cpRecQ plastid-targeted DNA helicase [Guillardia theta CCMP2712]|uniref:ATP-dependent DNA helicase n=1 Tax=Guillardia theta (strain CCMP2712) TaxID=905079 RepID=L1JFX7_GUITC|nr:cpRecQ plastid-targeted DNA helicase [Guillardia theta CCMP2712]EKX47418.1 cpRecQ plastid-targeted DNA helicase [Guillardia theta CCMP2712]|eukprot:XP_005834398.1 cpRecQ plastid-targeted DNA helicase [Guillardia theta CCMP2712]
MPASNRIHQRTSRDDPLKDEVDPLKEARLVLKRCFGYSNFRNGQEEAIRAAIAGQDSLVVMATGSGKSLCYQIPALVKRGIVIVISPLISLMHDQVSSLKARNISATSTNEPDSEYSVFSHGVRLFYVTPESALGRWKSRWKDLHARVGIELIAIDEAHCVSEWGHDFRPEYQRLYELREEVPDVPVMALTATATPRVQDEIIRNLSLGSFRSDQPSGLVRVVTTFDRLNLFYSAYERNSQEAISVFREIIDGSKQGNPVPAIVYALTQKDAEKVADKLVSLGIAQDSVAFYHAGMTDSKRTKIHDLFLKDKLHVVVATTAFGMGIDKPDIRHVIHWGAPKTIESYYQQSGRAGRDGEPSRCTLLYSGQDFMLASFYEKSGSSGELISEIARDALHQGISQMRQYCYLTSCRRIALLKHFGEKLSGNASSCGQCDNCLRKENGQTQVRDMSAEVRQFLGAVLDCKNAFGIAKYVNFLRGAAVPEWCKKTSGFGKGKNKSADWWKQLGQQLLSLDQPLLEEHARVGVANGRQQTFKIVKISAKGYEWLHSHENLPLPITLSKGMQELEDKEKWIGNQEQLLVLLRKTREEIASAQHLPASTVCPDPLLFELVIHRPADLDSLAEVEGVSQNFLEKYGTRFLKDIEYYSEGDEVGDKKKQEFTPSTSLPLPPRHA